MGKAVNQTELAEILGVSDVTLWEWQKNGLPIEQIGERGTANRYDTAKVIAWRVQQELQRAGKSESQRDREARLRGDMLELELGKERGLLVSVNEVKPTWEARVLVHGGVGLKIMVPQPAQNRAPRIDSIAGDLWLMHDDALEIPGYCRALDQSRGLKNYRHRERAEENKLAP